MVVAAAGDGGHEQLAVDLRRARPAVALEAADDLPERRRQGRRSRASGRAARVRRSTRGGAGREDRAVVRDGIVGAARADPDARQLLVSGDRLAGPFGTVVVRHPRLIVARLPAAVADAPDVRAAGAGQAIKRPVPFPRRRDAGGGRVYAVSSIADGPDIVG